MAIKLEGLEFQIEASSTKAEKKLKNLSDTLVRIRNAAKGGVGLGTVANQISKVADAVNRVDTDKMQRLATVCDTIRSTRGPATLARGFERMADAVNRIDVDRLERVRDAFQGMNGIQLPRLNVPGNTTTPATNTPADTPVDSGVENVTSHIEEAAASTSRLHGIVDSLRGVFTRTFTTGVGVLRTFGRAVTTVGNGIRMLGRVATVLPEKLGSGLAAKIKHTTSALGQFFASIKRIAMYRLIRTALKAITQGFSEGIKNLYHWSDALGGTFAKNMDKLATNALYLKNSLGAMVAPLINALAPAIDFITDKLVDLMNFVNQLIAKLSGASTYTVAKKVATEWDDASKKTKKATDEIKRYTLGFDELNILGKKDKDSSSSKKDETDYSSMFETKKVDSSVSDITAKLQGMFAVFKQAWAQEGEPTIAAAKGALDSVKSVISTVGDTFYKVFTGGYGFEWITSCLHVLQTVFGVVTAISNAFKTAWNDDNKGYSYIVSIFSMMTRVNELLASIGRAFINAWNNGIGVKIWSNILDIATGVNNVVGNLADSIKKAWDKAGLGEKIWNGLLTIVNTVLTAVNRIVSATEKWAANLNFEPILTAFNDLLTAINPVVEKVTGGLAWAYENVLLPVGKWTIEAGLPVLLGLVSAAFGLLNTVLDSLKEPALYIWDNFLQPIGEWTGGVIVSVLTGLTDVLKKLSDWIDTHKEAFDAIVETVGAFVAGWLGAKAIIGIISGITTAGSLLVGGLGTLAGSFNPVVLAIEAVIAAGVLIITHWDEIKEAAGKLRDTIAEKWKEISDKASELADKIYEFLEPVRTWSEGFVNDLIDGFNKIPENWKKLKQDAKTLWTGIKTNITGVWQNVTNWTSTTWDKVSNTLPSLWETLSSNAETTFSSIGTNISGAWETGKTALNDFISWVKGTFSVDWGTAWNGVVTGFGYIFNTIQDKLKAPINAVIKMLNSMIGKVEDTINKIVKGINKALSIDMTWNVPDWVPGIGGTTYGWKWSPNLKTVSWNKIAELAKGGILDGATLFGSLGDKALVGGEAGREAVLPLETHTEWMDNLANKVAVRANEAGRDDREIDLMREQNRLLQKLLEKDTTVEVTSGQIAKSHQRANRRAGVTVIPVG